MKIETEKQKKSRIFEHYKQYIKKPVNKGECCHSLEEIQKFFEIIEQ